jgi:hypothetical protein
MMMMMMMMTRPLRVVIVVVSIILRCHTARDVKDPNRLCIDAKNGVIQVADNNDDGIDKEEEEEEVVVCLMILEKRLSKWTTMMMMTCINTDHDKEAKSIEDVHRFDRVVRRGLLRRFDRVVRRGLLRRFETKAWVVVRVMTHLHSHPSVVIIMIHIQRVLIMERCRCMPRLLCTMRRRLLLILMVIQEVISPILLRNNPHNHHHYRPIIAIRHVRTNMAML